MIYLLFLLYRNVDEVGVVCSYDVGILFNDVKQFVCQFLGWRNYYKSYYFRYKKLVCFFSFLFNYLVNKKKF